MSKCKLNKEELLQLVKDFYTKNNRSPKLKEIRQVNGFPNIKVYYRVFETTTWNDILGLAGLEKNRTTKDIHTKESLKELLVEYYNKYNKVPTSKELGNKIGIPSGIVFYDRFGTQSWNEILDECGLPLNHYQGYTKDSMIDILKGIYTKYGKIPTRYEWDEYKILPNHGQYARVFGSIENACVLAGIIEQPPSKEEKVNNSIYTLKELSKKLNRVPSVWEYEDVLFKQGDKILNRRDVEKHLKLNYSEICSKYIKEYSYINSMAGTMCKDNNGDMCRSIGESDITNFLIHNNIEYVKEYGYKNITGNTKDRRRMDWKIVVDGVDYFIEYFGMYRHNMNKLKTPYVKKAHSKIEDFKKFGVFEFSILIYPEDLKKNKISEIFNNKLNKNYTEYISSDN